jgi:hypothetical protein
MQVFIKTRRDGSDGWRKGCVYNQDVGALIRGHLEINAETLYAAGLFGYECSRTQ